MQTNSIHSIEQSERFVVLVFDGLQLLIPQSDIYSLESTVDMNPAVAIGSVGQITHSGDAWSLYALSSALSLLDSYPETYRIAILMKNVQPVYGLLCEQVSTIARSEISIHRVPTAMTDKDSPLLALALVGEEVRYISSAAALNRLFPR